MNAHGYAGGNLLLQLVDWAIQNIELLLIGVIVFGLAIMLYLKGQIEGQKQGFVEGVKHHIHIQAYDKADFPATYEKDEYVLEAHKKLEKALKPKIPVDIQDDA
ncbi:hypothetical protein VSS37_02205 [Candidatus Thiothrix sp. Deng01]|uniref:Uncharacterized protein n=1 Tax=Candidatus Thiothrix phosphatis TaxID=3112415 RepID=A0ABU6CSN8_9GAMM|nr:hypothetical protein [Candidatus Thiothrix sp. Deng01]MEB4589784.1 hypothetical protein [Candidatus Thiothrix sp. Deng01]